MDQTATEDFLNRNLTPVENLNQDLAESPQKIDKYL